MPVRLGPMPAKLRELVGGWIEAGKRPGSPYVIDDTINALAITGGPGGASFLDANGDLWDWFVLDESPIKVRDETRKLWLGLIAVEQWPELAGWLPSRPAHAEDCRKCSGAGRFDWGKYGIEFCSECNGLGWTVKRRWFWF